MSADTADRARRRLTRDFYELFNDDIQSFTFFAPTQETTSFDDSDTAFGLVIGYRLTPHFAIEGGYAKFGQVTYKSRSSGNFPQEAGTEDIGIETETTGYTFAALGMLPLSRNWELFARAGALFANNKITIRVNAEGQQFMPPLGSFAAADSHGSTELARRPRHQPALPRDLRSAAGVSARVRRRRTAGPVARATWTSMLLGLIVTF